MCIVLHCDGKVGSVLFRGALLQIIQKEYTKKFRDIIFVGKDEGIREILLKARSKYFNLLGKVQTKSKPNVTRIIQEH